jgi:sarcosine reductase
VKLELESFRVDRIELGTRAGLVDGTLTVDRESLTRLLLDDPRLSAVAVDAVHPGDSARIVHVLDAVEPRRKLDPPGSAFPGVTGPPTMAGTGRTARLEGAAVVLAGLPAGADDPALWQEAVIEMSGPAAGYCPLSSTANLVLTVAPTPGLSGDETLSAMRLAAFRAAEHVADSVSPHRPDSVERLALDPVDGVPRVALVLQLEAWDTLQRTFLYGMSVEGLLPTPLHPNEVLDGAVTAGSYHLPAIRHCTYLFQNHGLVRELVRRQGRDLDFAAVVVARAMWGDYEDKRRAADFTAKLLRQLGAAGAIVSFSHGGHAVTDVVLAAEACERLGIRVATVMFEMAGEDGFDFSLVQMARDAAPLVSTGNIDAVLALPPVERMLGGDEILGIGGHAHTRHDAAGALSLPVRHLFAAASPAGNGRLAARAG